MARWPVGFGLNEGVILWLQHLWLGCTRQPNLTFQGRDTGCSGILVVIDSWITGSPPELPLGNLAERVHGGSAALAGRTGGNLAATSWQDWLQSAADIKTAAEEPVDGYF